MKENILQRTFDSFASRTFLAIFGLAGTILSIYAFLEEKKVDLRYEVIANTNVLDFNEEVSKLDVIYDSTNLKQTHENLRIYTVKIINNGDENIIKEFYDENEPLGIKITSGKIIERPQVIQASNDYLLRNLKIAVYQYNSISFSQVIMETGEYFIIKLLVLHKKGTIPDIVSLGKIAGQNKITVVNAIDVQEETTLWVKSLSGEISVQLLRLLAYFVSGVLLIAAIVFVAQQIESYHDKKKRANLIKAFKRLESYQYTRMDDAIFDRYLEHGP
jgi:hypothetical protein